MRSCILLFYISLLAGPALARPPEAESLRSRPRSLALGGGATRASEDADRLYSDRTNLASARRAADLWAAELKTTPGSFETAWKLARADYWLGGHAESGDRRGFLEGGIEAARKAAALQPMRPEGHFWMAANMGALAESFGLRAGLKYRKPIKDELETVLKLDPAFMAGSADRALGRWYFKVPGLFGGSTKKAGDHLRASLKYDDQSTITRFFLAEVLLDEGRKTEGRAELQRVIDAPLNPEWTPEDQDYKARARALLAQLRARD